MTDTVAEIAVRLTKAQREALLRAGPNNLLQSQSDRGTLVGVLTDYSFRPAKISPLGLAVRNYLLSQEQSNDR